MNDPASVDQELNLRALVGLAVALIVLIVATGGLMLGVSRVLQYLEAAQDPPPPALEEARQPYTPPAPRLQSDPLDDLQALREREAEILESYRWVDEDAGIAQIPIARTMELIATGELSLGPAPGLAGGGEPPSGGAR